MISKTAIMTAVQNTIKQSMYIQGTSGAGEYSSGNWSATIDTTGNTGTYTQQTNNSSPFYFNATSPAARTVTNLMLSSQDYFDIPVGTTLTADQLLKINTYSTSPLKGIQITITGGDF